MKKSLLVAAAVLIAAGMFTGSALARERGNRGDRGALTANQIVALADARTARIKADLRLTPEQEMNWPGLETALRDVAKERADRIVALRAEREQREQKKESADVIEYLNGHAKLLAERSAHVKKIADAAQPLYASLDEQQKRRFAHDLIRLSRDRDAE